MYHIDIDNIVTIAQSHSWVLLENTYFSNELNSRVFATKLCAVAIDE